MSNCAWNHQGDRCAYPGSMSHGTRGDGPWYCAAHFFCSDAVSGGRIVAESTSVFVPAETPYLRPPTPLARLPYRDDDGPVLVQEEPGAAG